MELLGLLMSLAGVAGIAGASLGLLLTGKRYLPLLLPLLLVGVLGVVGGAAVSDRARERVYADRCIELGGVVGVPGELCLTRWSDGTSPVIEVP